MKIFILFIRFVTMAKSAKSEKEGKNILIIYEKNDAATWAEYIQKEFANKGPKVGGVEIIDLKTNADDIGNLCKQFIVIVLLISPEMLDTLRIPTVQLAPCLTDHCNVAVVKLYLEECESKFQQVIRQFSRHKYWNTFDLTATDTETRLHKAVSDILDTLQLAKQLAAEPPKQKKQASLISLISPDTIRQVGRHL